MHQPGAPGPRPGAGPFPMNPALAAQAGHHRTTAVTRAAALRWWRAGYQAGLASRRARAPGPGPTGPARRQLPRPARRRPAGQTRRAAARGHRGARRSLQRAGPPRQPPSLTTAASKDHRQDLPVRPHRTLPTHVQTAWPLTDGPDPDIVPPAAQVTERLPGRHPDSPASAGPSPGNGMTEHRTRRRDRREPAATGRSRHPERSGPRPAAAASTGAAASRPVHRLTGVTQLGA